MAPPRAIWTGSISFGLVNAPVRMYTAIRENDLRFNMLHQPDGGRIGYVKVCKTDDKPVPDDEIVRAYDVGGGEFVELSDEDFAAASANGEHHLLTIHDFVPIDQIDPIYFERTYYLGPQEGPGEAIYALLAEAMSSAGLAAIATYIHHNREHLGCLRVRDGVITLERMFFSDEVRSSDGLAPEATVDERQLKMAADLIEAYTGDFDPTQYQDTYRDKLLAVIEQKRQGKTVKPPEVEKGEAPPDLMAALTASLEEARKARAERESKPKPKASGGKRPKAAAAAGGGKAPAKTRRRAS
jgi:DNA end-binding protein Ku